MQHTPDGDTTYFIYDDLGRLRFSQNGNQQAEGTCSYTKYDHLSRVIEVGKSNYDLPFVKGYRNDRTFPPKGVERTITVYSLPDEVKYLDGRSQRFLNNRVSYTIYDEDGKLNTEHDQVMTAYSYDPHGNVEWLVETVPGMGKTYLRYEYDLISGNVTRVAFNEGMKSQFYHKYEYDADNRIRSCFTSIDGYIWEEDANYEYFPHGPLKRIELGNDHVQGIDYTYTLQGWLKAVNHPSLEIDNDPGMDGNANGGDLTAADAFGMGLNYYAGDYKRNGQTRFSSDDQYMLNPGNDENLFNGNISSWVSHVSFNAPFDNEDDAKYELLTGNRYTYDALNRLLNSDFRYYKNDSWKNTDEYDTEYKYDKNGNILELNRYGLGGGNPIMDELQYSYYPGTNQLKDIKDKVPGNKFNSGIVSQQDNNYLYLYDSIGNMIESKKDSIRVEWNLAGKVRSVHRLINDGNDTLHINYTYNASGNRVRKYTRNTLTGLEDTTFYARDAQGNIMGIFSSDNNGFALTERPMYGNDRLGSHGGRIENPLEEAPGQDIYSRSLGQKKYELKDHLGNVRALVSDRKNITLSSQNHPKSATPDPLAYNHYYPFGMIQPGRSFNAGNYRFGMNGMESDPEISGN